MYPAFSVFHVRSVLKRGPPWPHNASHHPRPYLTSTTPTLTKKLNCSTWFQKNKSSTWFKGFSPTMPALPRPPWIVILCCMLITRRGYAFSGSLHTWSHIFGNTASGVICSCRILYTFLWMHFFFCTGRLHIIEQTVFWHSIIPIFLGSYHVIIPRASYRSRDICPVWNKIVIFMGLSSGAILMYACL